VPERVRVDVVNGDDEPAGLRGQRTWRRELVFGGDAMEPDPAVSRDDLTVDDVPVAVALDTAGAETECVDEEVVRALDVLVDEKRNDALDSRHGATVARSCTEVR
jgi:hypothetical protein